MSSSRLSRGSSTPVAEVHTTTGQQSSSTGNSALPPPKHESQSYTSSNAVKSSKSTGTTTHKQDMSAGVPRRESSTASSSTSATEKSSITGLKMPKNTSQTGSSVAASRPTGDHARYPPYSPPSSKPSKSSSDTTGGGGGAAQPVSSDSAEGFRVFGIGNSNSSGELGVKTSTSATHNTRSPTQPMVYSYEAKTSAQTSGEGRESKTRYSESSMRSGEDNATTSSTRSSTEKTAGKSLLQQQKETVTDQQQQQQPQERYSAGTQSSNSSQPSAFLQVTTPGGTRPSVGSAAPLLLGDPPSPSFFRMQHNGSPTSKTLDGMSSILPGASLSNRDGYSLIGGIASNFPTPKNEGRGDDRHQRRGVHDWYVTGGGGLAATQGSEPESNDKGNRRSSLYHVDSISGREKPVSPLSGSRSHHRSAFSTSPELAAGAASSSSLGGAAPRSGSDNGGQRSAQEKTLERSPIVRPPPLNSSPLMHIQERKHQLLQKQIEALAQKQKETYEEDKMDQKTMRVMNGSPADHQRSAADVIPTSSFSHSVPHSSAYVPTEAPETATNGASRIVHWMGEQAREVRSGDGGGPPTLYKSFQQRMDPERLLGTRFGASASAADEACRVSHAGGSGKGVFDVDYDLTSSYQDIMYKYRSAVLGKKGKPLEALDRNCVAGRASNAFGVRRYSAAVHQAAPSSGISLGPGRWRTSTTPQGTAAAAGTGAAHTPTSSLRPSLLSVRVRQQELQQNRNLPKDDIALAKDLAYEEVANRTRSLLAEYSVAMRRGARGVTTPQELNAGTSFSCSTPPSLPPPPPRGVVGPLPSVEQYRPAAQLHSAMNVSLSKMSKADQDLAAMRSLYFEVMKGDLARNKIVSTSQTAHSSERKSTPDPLHSTPDGYSAASSARQGPDRTLSRGQSPSIPTSSAQGLGDPAAGNTALPSETQREAALLATVKALRRQTGDMTAQLAAAFDEWRMRATVSMRAASKQRRRRHRHASSASPTPSPLPQPTGLVLPTAQQLFGDLFPEKAFEKVLKDPPLTREPSLRHPVLSPPPNSAAVPLTAQQLAEDTRWLQEDMASGLTPTSHPNFGLPAAPPVSVQMELYTIRKALQRQEELSKAYLAQLDELRAAQNTTQAEPNTTTVPPEYSAKLQELAEAVVRTGEAVSTLHRNHEELSRLAMMGGSSHTKIKSNHCRPSHGRGQRRAPYTSSSGLWSSDSSRRSSWLHSSTCSTPSTSSRARERRHRRRETGRRNRKSSSRKRKPFPTESSSKPSSSSRLQYSVLSSSGMAAAKQKAKRLSAAPPALDCVHLSQLQDDELHEPFHEPRSAVTDTQQPAPAAAVTYRLQGSNGASFLLVPSSPDDDRADTNGVLRESAPPVANVSGGRGGGASQRCDVGTNTPRGSTRSASTQNDEYTNGLLLTASESASKRAQSSPEVSARGLPAPPGLLPHRGGTSTSGGATSNERESSATESSVRTPHIAVGLGREANESVPCVSEAQRDEEAALERLAEVFVGWLVALRNERSGMGLHVLEHLAGAAAPSDRPDHHHRRVKKRHHHHSKKRDKDGKAVFSTLSGDVSHVRDQYTRDEEYTAVTSESYTLESGQHGSRHHRHKKRKANHVKQPATGEVPQETQRKEHKAAATTSSASSSDKLAPPLLPPHKQDTSSTGGGELRLSVPLLNLSSPVIEAANAEDNNRLRYPSDKKRDSRPHPAPLTAYEVVEHDPAAKRQAKDKKGSTPITRSRENSVTQNAASTTPSPSPSPPAVPPQPPAVVVKTAPASSSNPSRDDSLVAPPEPAECTQLPDNSSEDAEKRKKSSESPPDDENTQPKGRSGSTTATILGQGSTATVSNRVISTPLPTGLLFSSPSPDNKMLANKSPAGQMHGLPFLPGSTSSSSSNTPKDAPAVRPAVPSGQVGKVPAVLLPSFPLSVDAVTPPKRTSASPPQREIPIGFLPHSDIPSLSELTPATTLTFTPQLAERAGAAADDSTRRNDDKPVLLDVPPPVTIPVKPVALFPSEHEDNNCSTQSTPTSSPLLRVKKVNLKEEETTHSASSDMTYTYLLSSSSKPSQDAATLSSLDPKKHRHKVRRKRRHPSNNKSSGAADKMKRHTTALTSPDTRSVETPEKMRSTKFVEEPKVAVPPPPIASPSPDSTSGQLKSILLSPPALHPSKRIPTTTPPKAGKQRDKHRKDGVAGDSIKQTPIPAEEEIGQLSNAGTTKASKERKGLFGFLHSSKEKKAKTDQKKEKDDVKKSTAQVAPTTTAEATTTTLREVSATPSSQLSPETPSRLDPSASVSLTTESQQPASSVRSKAELKEEAKEKKRLEMAKKKASKERMRAADARMREVLKRSKERQRANRPPSKSIFKRMYHSLTCKSEPARTPTPSTSEAPSLQSTHPSIASRGGRSRAPGSPGRSMNHSDRSFTSPQLSPRFGPTSSADFRSEQSLIRTPRKAMR